MKAALAIAAVVLALPMLLVVGIALGPVLLLVVWALLCVAPFLLVGWASVRISESRWRHRAGERSHYGTRASPRAVASSPGSRRVELPCRLTVHGAAQLRQAPNRVVVERRHSAVAAVAASAAA